MSPKETAAPAIEKTWPEYVTSYTKNLTRSYFVINAVRFLAGRLCLGDFLFNTTWSLIVSSTLHGGHFSRDLQSTITILLYFAGYFPLRCFLLLAIVQLLSSQRTRQVYEQALEPAYKPVYEKEEFWTRVERSTRLWASVEWTLNYVKEFGRIPAWDAKDRISFDIFLAEKRVGLVVWRKAKQPEWEGPPDLPGAAKL